MKKVVLLGFLLCAILANSNAQLPFNLGIKGGITSSTFTLNKVESIYYGENTLKYDGNDFITDASNGLNIGVFARLKLKRFFIQPEGNINVRNGKMNINVSGIDPSNPTNVDYISQGIKLSTLDIPLLFGVTAIDLRVLKVNIFTGPTASILLNEQITFTPNFKIESEEVAPESVSIDNPNFEEFNIEDELEKASWNWQAGVGADIGNFYLDVRYEYGINNLTKLDFEQKSNMLIFSVGFKFF